MNTKEVVHSWLVLLLAVFVVGIFAFILGEPREAIGAATDPILKIHNASLTTYKPTSATNVQDIFPQSKQRGVGIDGALRGPNAFGFAIAGNPSEAKDRSSGIEEVLGVLEVTDIDISLPAVGFRWRVGRSYNSRQASAGGGHHDSAGYQGNNWHQISQPEIVFYDDATTAADDLVVLVYGADRYVEYKRLDTSSNRFKGVNGAAGVLEYAAGAGGEPDTYTLTDQHSNKVVFFGFNTSSNTTDGQFWKMTDADNNVAYVGDPTTASTAITNGFSGGRITKAYDTDSRRYTYTYNGSNLLTSVKVETKTGATWASPGVVTEVARVDYEYYSTDGSHGKTDDLQLVEVKTYMTDRSPDVYAVQKKYYRYWGNSAYHATSHPGHAHGIKLVVGFEGTRNYDWGDSNFDEDFINASDADLKPYSEAYVEYSASREINSLTRNGDCACGGSSNNGEQKYTYETNTGYTDNTGYDQAWATRTTVEHPETDDTAPDSSHRVEYFDEVGQRLHRVLCDKAPTAQGVSYWPTKVVRNSSGQITEMHTPAAIQTYAHSTGTLSTGSASGLVYLFNRLGSGTAMEGFLEHRKWRKGGGTEWKQLTLTYSSANVAISTDAHVVRPFIASRREFPEGTTGTTGSHLWQWTTTVHSETLATKQVTATEPAIGTARNGSGSSNTTSRYFEKDGTLTFLKSQTGRIEYREYTSGLLTKAVRDADTTGLSPPSGFSHTGTPVSQTTTYSYDAQGRLDAKTLPGSQVKKAYYSRLADHRLVVLAYNDYESSPPTVYGPVRYSVFNQAGRTDATAIIELASNESTTAFTGHISEASDDVIAAVTFESAITRLRTHQYSDSGIQELSSRKYFVTPSTGGGTDGTHYDQTDFVYDDMGRRIEVSEPNGTIRETVYDFRGHRLSSWIGTDNTGGQNDNMVKTVEFEFDGGVAGGNGYLTKQTQYVDDTTTDKRVTTFANDQHGRVLLVTKPQPPHSLIKYDNMGRTLARGAYSSAPASDKDPTTWATNRLALAETAYDELGRVYRTTRHKVDSADGSLDDSLLSDTWYDQAGRQAKIDGAQLVKFGYDRLSRQTHQYVLAKDNDGANYADTLDVTGDTVLSEEQRAYTNTHDSPVMTGVITRTHDDTTTTGPLDTNGDSDPLKYTASNIAGRIQITATWYDQFGRPSDAVGYGTYNDATFDRDELTVPTRSDTALRTSYSYHGSGAVHKITDPRNVTTEYTYDDGGRRTKTIRNLTGGGSPAESDDNQTTILTYVDGLVTEVKKDIASPATDPVTTYTYGTTKGTSGDTSRIATGHFLSEVAYADSASASDVVKLNYNAQGEGIRRTDQAGTVIVSAYDTGGRRTSVHAESIATGFDSYVDKITFAYTNLGQPEKITQSGLDGANRNTRDEVKITRDGWGLVSTLEQDHNSAIDSDKFALTFGYAKSTTGRNVIRPTAFNYDSGTAVTYAYTSTYSNEASRVSAVKIGVTTVATYEYLGIATRVRTYYDEPDVFSSLYDVSDGSYDGLDRFNRVISNQWTKDLATDHDFYDVDIAYDRNSNITRIEDHVHHNGAGTPNSLFDVAFTHDDLNRVTQAQEGHWTGSVISPESRDEIWDWTLSGSIENMKLDLNGDNDYVDSGEFNDTRTFNGAGELGQRDVDSDQTVDYSLSYDAVGNMTDDGKSYDYEYDVFGRLVEVRYRGAATIVAEYRYNGLGNLIGEHKDTNASGGVTSADNWYFFVYDGPGQRVATYRVATTGTPLTIDTYPKEEYVHHVGSNRGLRHGVILRDRDANTAWTSAADSVREERYYYCDNWRGDVSVIIDSADNPIEWVKYSTFGIPFGIPCGDLDGDGACGAADLSLLGAMVASSGFDARADANNDGSVTGADVTIIQSTFYPTTLGTGVLSASNVANRIGSAGRLWDDVIDEKYHVGAGAYSAELAIWLNFTEDDAVPDDDREIADDNIYGTGPCEEDSVVYLYGNGPPDPEKGEIEIVDAEGNILRNDGNGEGTWTRVGVCTLAEMPPMVPPSTQPCVCDLCIWSSTDSTSAPNSAGGSANCTSGHSWLTLQCPNGPLETFGLYAEGAPHTRDGTIDGTPDGPDGDEIELIMYPNEVFYNYYNERKYMNERQTEHDCVKITCAEALDLRKDLLTNPDYEWKFTYTCASFAVDTWNRFSVKKYDANDWRTLGGETPSALESELKAE